MGRGGRESRQVRSGQSAASIRDQHLVVGARIRVISIAVDEMERLGYVQDSAELPPGSEGTVKAIRGAVDSPYRQLEVDWDNGSRLMIVADDEIEVMS